MAGSAFYGYHIERNERGRAVVVRNIDNTFRGGNYYSTKAKALAATKKHNALMKRASKGKRLRNPRGRMIPVKLVVSGNGTVKVMVSPRHVR